MIKERELSEILDAPIVKRSVTIAGHASSVSIEKPFWDAFKAIADEKGTSINKLVTKLDDARVGGESVNLSSAIRLYVLESLKQPS